MMNKSEIDWCDFSWNPVTGCRRGCEYCYARNQARRFSGDVRVNVTDPQLRAEEGTTGKIYTLRRPFKNSRGTTIPHPAGFEPTFHEYRLGDPARKKKPASIFVCSMADLFGDWVPDDWIMRVFDACCDVPRHRYLFLTKNPARYTRLAKAGMLPRRDNFWYGSTATTPDTLFWWSDYHNTFVSIEPMLEAFQPAGDCPVKKVDWIIMGAMSGPGSKDHQPKKEWINPLVEDAQALSVPVFMKDSLIPIVGEENMLRQFPWPTQTQKGAAQDAGVGVAQDTLMPAT